MYNRQGETHHLNGARDSAHTHSTRARVELTEMRNRTVQFPKPASVPMHFSELENLTRTGAAPILKRYICCPDHGSQRLAILSES